MDFKINDDEINVKDIMRQIKANTSKRVIKDDLLNKPLTNRNSDISLGEIENHQYSLNKMWHYSADEHITSHRRFIGIAIVFGKKVMRKLLRWYMNPVVTKQVEFNAETARTINVLVDKIKDLHNTNIVLQEEVNQIHVNKKRIDEIAATNQEVQKLHDEVKTLSSIEEYVHDNRERIEQLSSDIQYMKQFEDKIQLNKERIKEMLSSMDQSLVNNEAAVSKDDLTEFQQVKNELSAFKLRIEEIVHSDRAAIRVATERLKRIERLLNKEGVSIREESLVDVKDNSQSDVIKLDFDYFLFEELYRGSRDQIIERQKNYLKYFKAGQYVLDLGCGRGEFTELLLENGVEVTAVDMNDDMVLYCQERGFPIIQADILKYLDGIEDGSVDGIFLGQVIEHLDTQHLIALTKLAHKKLKPTGKFIAETPNPQCLSIFAQSFYMDPTHTKPVHAYTCKFIVESAGFNKVEVHYLSPNDEQLRLPEIKLEGINDSSLQQFNETIHHWNNVIFGYQDYYVLGVK